MKDSFETIYFPLSTQYDGFNGRCDLGAGSNVVFMYIPSGVRVFFTTDSNSTSKIEAKQGLKIKTNHDCLFFTTIGTSSESMVIAHWGGDNVNIELPPISTFESLNGFGLNAFNQLSKAMNPYDQPTLTIGRTSSPTTVSLLSKTLTCDKISFIIGAGGGSNYWGMVDVYLNGVNIAHCRNFYTISTAVSFDGSVQHTIEGVRGKVLEIAAYSASGFSHFALNEYTLKA